MELHVLPAKLSVTASQCDLRSIAALIKTTSNDYQILEAVVRKLQRTLESLPKVSLTKALASLAPLTSAQSEFRRKIDGCIDHLTKKLKTLSTLLAGQVVTSNVMASNTLRAVCGLEVGSELCDSVTDKRYQVTEVLADCVTDDWAYQYTSNKSAKMVA